MERHKQAVRAIASTVRSFFDRSEPYRIFHGSTNSTRPSHLKSGTRFLDISALSNVLEVNTAKRVAFVEPNVPMDRLVEHTLKYGLVPPVVMEFPGITAGGGYAGTAGESSSFRHGYFDDNVVSVEMVLPDGEVIEAKPDEGHPYRDLFKGAAGAVGTLGVTTLLQLRLIEAKRYVRTTYRRTNSVAEAIAAVKEECANKDNDYVDGILYSKDHGVIVTGQMTDELPSPSEKVQTFSGAWDPWYYLHVQERTKSLPSSMASSPSASSQQLLSQGSVTEYIPLAEYLFRYDRGGFWVGAAAFGYFRPVPFTRFFRWFLDDFLHTRMLYRALHASGESGRFVVQDLGIPYDTAEKFIDYTAEKLDIWPLWLCPLKTPSNQETFHPHLRGSRAATGKPGQQQSGEMLNVGLWGWGPEDPDKFVAVNRSIEDKVAELGGTKWFYAHTYYSESEFWQVYGPRAWYDALRTKYKATSLPSVYDKVRVRDNPRKESGWKPWLKAKWPVGGIWGIYKGIKSRDYMLHRNAVWKWDHKAREHIVVAQQQQNKLAGGQKAKQT
ncbi:hypothetical protein Micbo1qcDRAFT_168629 [Microdochium bolleyi]|uniref:Delta(24)-sterol reductase n=1 Tax=Microdochium bolleyi TaxID=196109 RepID=A0A136IMW5_9PEZI|nr:hypothetical protein Micbo1qcDRAFT_168629 [Microdochium bolleyi]